MTKKYPETSRVRWLGLKIIRYVDKYNFSLHVYSPVSYSYNILDGCVGVIIRRDASMNKYLNRTQLMFA